MAAIDKHAQSALDDDNWNLWTDCKGKVCRPLHPLSKASLPLTIMPRTYMRSSKHFARKNICYSNVITTTASQLQYVSAFAVEHSDINACTLLQIADGNKFFSRVYTETSRYIRFVVETWSGLAFMIMFGGVGVFDIFTMFLYASGGTVVLGLLLVFCLVTSHPWWSHDFNPQSLPKCAYADCFFWLSVLSYTLTRFLQGTLTMWSMIPIEKPLISIRDSLRTSSMLLLPGSNPSASRRSGRK